MEQLTFDDPGASVHDLERWCNLANIAAYEILGYRNSCILTSHALVAFLRELGLDAEPFRAEVRIFPVERTPGIYGTTLGGDSLGVRRPAARPGCWWGHLAVSCGAYVLDPTIDQGEVGGQRVRPAVFAKPPRWEEFGGHLWYESGLSVCHSKYYRQVGWKSAPDARPSHWMDVVSLMQDVA